MLVHFFNIFLYILFCLSNYVLPRPWIFIEFCVFKNLIHITIFISFSIFFLSYSRRIFLLFSYSPCFSCFISIRGRICFECLHCEVKIASSFCNISFIFFAFHFEPIFFLFSNLHDFFRV